MHRIPFALGQRLAWVAWSQLYAAAILHLSLRFALDSATGRKRESMIKQKKYGTPDKDNPEWTAEDFARSIKFKDLPESLQRTLSKPKRPHLTEEPPTKPSS